MFWIKATGVEPTPQEPQINILYVSKSLVGYLKKANRLVFGQKEIQITVEEDSSILLGVGSNFSDPALIKLSKGALDQLLIPETGVYRLKMHENKVLLGPVIGFLLGDQHYYYHHRRLKDLTYAMGAYEQVGGLFIAFRHCSVDWEERCIYGLYFDFTAQRWLYGKLPLPTVVYRRGFNSKNNFVTECKDLVNWQVFNEIRFDKWQFHNKLMKNQMLQKYLPETELATVENVVRLLRKHPKIILKPIKLSRGRGITILTLRADDTIVVHDYRHFKDFTIPLEQLPGYLQEGRYLEDDYILQQFLDMSRIEGAPWDIRVVMQKNGCKQWVCNGIECRLAGAGKMITNISNGGRALDLSEALKSAFAKATDVDKVTQDIINICLEFCKMMDSTGYHFAEFGLDLALDQRLNYWFIEANVRPSFNGFKSIGMEIYRRICFEPIFYSAAIAGFTGRSGEDGS